MKKLIIVIMLMKGLAIIFIGLLFYLSGCCSSPTVRETVTVHEDTVFVPIQGRVDTVTLRNDFTGEDVRYIVRVDTLLKKVYINMKAETLKVVVHDTLRVVERTVEEKKSFFDGITLMQILKGGFILLVFGVIVFVGKTIFGAVK